MRKKLKKSGVFIIGMLCFIVQTGLAKKPAADLYSPLPTKVQVVKAENSVWQDSIKLTGTLADIKGFTISPEISGRITKIFFKSGQYIKQGAPIIQIFPDIIKADLAKTQAQLRLSEVNYERYLQLYKKRFYDKAELDKAKAILEGDKADVAKLKAQLGQTLIRAPFDGKLGLRQISVGEYVTAGQGIVNLEAIDPIRVDFSVPEVYLDKLHIGDKVKVFSYAYPNDNYEGKVYAFNSVIDAKTRSLDMRASLPNLEHKLIPGSFVEITLFVGEPQQVIIIPQTAIVYSPSGNYVYRTLNGKAVKTKVVLGRKLTDNKNIVIKGLKSGESIIDGGQLKIHDGSDITVEQGNNIKQ